MTLEEGKKAVRIEDALEFCRKQSMLEQVVGNEEWKHYHYASIALEKQIPKKPNYEGDGYDDDGNLIYDTWICPNCEDRYEVDYEVHAHCPSCGQALDWSGESE